MSDDRTPHVSVVTPVFNGEKYLAQCIKSVVDQTYKNWTYTIVDNCSTDGSRAIAMEAAKHDPRIRVVTNTTFVSAVENHNIAVRQTSPESEYCKLLSADDWLFPEYLSNLVALGERHPSAAVISCYVVNRSGIPFPDLPVNEEFFSGPAAAADFLRGKVERFWLPTSVVFRASVVRATDPFYPGSAPSFDLEVCLDCLAKGDLAFRHQVLAFERLHDESITAGISSMNSTILDRMRILHAYGPRFLAKDEYEAVVERVLWHYYTRVLAPGLFELRGSAFRRVHQRGLRQIGRSFIDWRLAVGLAFAAADILLNPLHSLKRLARRARRTWHLN
jgi:glycosyltransferase involved in cell wall biosynthesis